jgi:hypothetical protein
MTLAEFRASLAAAAPPPALSAALTALWWDARGDWNRAHNAVDSEESTEAARVHAYLHRKEGNTPNAAYWYRHAGVPIFSGPLAEEAQALLRELTE